MFSSFFILTEAKNSKKRENFVSFFEKPIDKRGKTKYNLNEPNGSKRKGGQNEIKKHGSLFNDCQLCQQIF